MPVAHNKVIIGFANESGQLASTAFAYQVGVPLTTASALQAWSGGIAASIPTNIGSTLLALMDANTTIVSVKCLYLLGKVQIASGITSLGTPKAGTGTAPHPAQVSCVFSALTGLSGKSFRGRIYWPATGAAITAGGTFSQTLATLASDMTLFIKGVIASAAGAPSGAIFGVYSPTRDIMTLGTSIRVGNVPDIQRRRRQKAETVALAGL